jgi:hypothetical protein
MGSKLSGALQGLAWQVSMAKKISNYTSENANGAVVTELPINLSKNKRNLFKNTKSDGLESSFFERGKTLSG